MNADDAVLPPAPPSPAPTADKDALAELAPVFSAPLALTFDDVLLLPQYSEVLPHQADLTTFVGGLRLPLPLLSAAMDTVTEAAMAAAVAQAGGLGVLHKNLTPEAQAAAVAAVKATAVQGADRAACDGGGRLLVAAAIGVGEAGLARAHLLAHAGVDALVVDTAHGHSAGVLAAVRTLRAHYPKLVLVAGNVASAQATLALAEAGADVIKVGIGPGSICTTRSVSGVGVPQLSAVAACAQAARTWRAAGRRLHVIADGGVKVSADVVKALAVGADAVMVGSLLAGADEAPGAVVDVDGVRMRAYRGMGSQGAMRAGSADRYFQGAELGGSKKLVAEGVAARVRATGPVGDTLHQLQGGLRAGMGYVGARDLVALRQRARFVRQSGAGLSESRVHGVSPVADDVPAASGPRSPH